jgi:hypothetical protein
MLQPLGEVQLFSPMYLQQLLCLRVQGLSCVLRGQRVRPPLCLALVGLDLAATYSVVYLLGLRCLAVAVAPSASVFEPEDGCLHLGTC